ncbi:MAG TPA: hypothetical protein VGY98_04375 [Verrucomicrobiae bacterium]|nr:hypothetical protein [Verrucomicrobiae bacterium]
MNTYQNPKWWTQENDSAWERVKEAFKRDWDQTKHDFGAREPDTAQNVGNTVKQASGKEPIPPRGSPAYEKIEPAYRFGYGAKSFYRQKHPKWDKDLETQLKRDWQGSYPQGNWDEDVIYIRRGWEYDAEMEDERMEHKKAA